MLHFEDNSDFKDKIVAKFPHKKKTVFKPSKTEIFVIYSDFNRDLTA